MSDIPQSDEELIRAELFGRRPPMKARFYLHGAKDGDASEAAGYPVYTDKVYVEIKQADSTDFVSYPAKRQHMAEHKDAYALFERTRGWNQHSLELLPGVTPALLATLRDFNFHTIEQLAAFTPETAPWMQAKLGEDESGDPYPNLNGALPPTLEPLQMVAKRFVQFVTKPRLRLIDGELKEIA